MVGRRPQPVPDTGWELPSTYPSLQGQGLIAIDCETCDPSIKTHGPGWNRDGRIVGIAVGTEAGFRQYYPIDHEPGPNLPKADVLQWLDRELRSSVPKVGANLMYDVGFLTAAGVQVEGPFYDVQFAEPLLDENLPSYSLEVLSLKWLGEGKNEEVMVEWLEALFSGDAKGNIWRAPSTLVGPYAESDVDLPLRIFAKQRTELESRGLWDLFILECKLIPMLLAMRRRGVPINLDKAQQLHAKLTKRQETAEAEIKRLSGHKVDIWAAESLAKMFDDMGIAYPRTEKTHAPSFRRGWLESCSIPVAQHIVEARRMDKFRGTFIQGYILEGHINGRIHCQFHPLRGDEGGTVSGRFSSSTPNLQNLPIRDPELGPLIRALFEPESGQWWKMDWSQIEFRLAVHYAALLELIGSEYVVQQYLQDPATDYHEVVARMVGWWSSGWTAAQNKRGRDRAKGINFGLIYGLGVDGLCRQLDVEKQEGLAILRNYHDRVPFVKPLYDAALRRAEREGQIITLGSRHRHFDLWECRGKISKEKTEGSRRAFTHKALNALLQGSAADIMKKGMVQIWESGVCDALGAPHLTVHDELDGSVEPDARGIEALREVKHIMESCVQLRIPLRADQSVGPNWGEA